MDKHAINNLFGAGQITATDDDGNIQTVQVTQVAYGSGFADRVLDKVPRVAQFGFTSVPPINSQVLVISRNGDRTLSVAIGTSHGPSRPTGMQPGDSALYDVRGAIIKLTAEGLTIDCAGLPLVVQNTSGMHVKGALTVDDDITGLAESEALALSTIRSTFNTHDHSGVTTGTGNTAAPVTTL